MRKDIPVYQPPKPPTRLSAIKKIAHFSQDRVNWSLVDQKTRKSPQHTWSTSIVAEAIWHSLKGGS